MSRSRMMKHDDPEDVPAPSPRTTIVGGRPPEKDTGQPPVPVGIQRLLRLASVDEEFRRKLVEQRGAVAEAAEVALTASERAILGAIPAHQLREMATKMPPPPASRRAFLRQTAATAVVLLGGAALAEGLGACRKTGPESPDAPKTSESYTSASDEPTPDRPEHRDMETEGGAEPDMPEPTPDRPDHPEAATGGGAAPDMPEVPERPDHPPTHTKGGSEPDMPQER